MATIEKDLKEAKDSEIDLLDLLSLAWKGLSRATRVASIFLIWKSLWLISFVLLGGCVAFLFFKTSERQYTSTMMAQANVLTNNYVIDYVNQLGEIKNPLVRARVLNISIFDSKHVAGLHAFYGIDTNNDGIPDYINTKTTSKIDTSLRRVPNIFYVQVTVSEESIFSSISGRIIETLKSNPHLVERNRVRIEQLRERIAELEGQYQLLDSLERYEYFNSERLMLKSTGQMLVLNEKARQLYHDPLLSIRNSILSLQQELALYSEPITIIQDFSALSIADNPFTYYVIRCVLIFLVLGIIFLLIRHNWATIWKLIRER
jgi:hypothetical protein